MYNNDVLNYEQYIEKEDFREFVETIAYYRFALKEIETKVDILNSEYKLLKMYNPIEHVKSRVKKPASIKNKLKRKNLDLTRENIVENIKDVAGIRIICSFKKDIFKVASMLKSQNDIEVVSVKDYVTEPKENGYQSYHMVVNVPVFLSEKVEKVTVEVQIRTSAMDFWASIEHKINYKKSNNMTAQLKQKLKECAVISSKLDDEMYEINKILNKFE